MRQVDVFDDAAQFAVRQGQLDLPGGVGGDGIRYVGEDDAVRTEVEVVGFVSGF